MFGKNKIRTSREYQLLPARSLAVTKIFFALQEDGPFQGQPTVTLILTGCHLACPFCDTSFDRGEIWSFDDIFAKITTSLLQYYGKKRLVSLPLQKIMITVTGGEPLLQIHLYEFLRECHHKHNFCTYVETTGTVPSYIPADSIVMLSPKKDVRTGEQLLLNKEVFKRADYMKVVISKTDKHYNEIPLCALNWHAMPAHYGRLYLSPMRVPKDEIKTRENRDYAAHLAMHYGARLTLPL